MKKAAVKFVGYLLKTHFPHLFQNFPFYGYVGMWVGIYILQCKCGFRVLQHLKQKMFSFYSLLPPQKCKNANFMHDEIFKIGIQIFHLNVNFLSAYRWHVTCHRLEEARNLLRLCI